ncbi:MAG: succinate dehydrogenase, hydrophobic membrane anchor protein [Gammaproteobacteria bacterium]|nr:MAG: succinate dehydrogenase, hydrophobic membrane anchor protein [Gammaproteobacteria bacterium]
MVNNAATVGRSGVHDFILIRTSAIVLTLYTLFIAYFFISTTEVTYAVWHGFFANLGVKIFTMLALISLLIHLWIGIWQVLSDYVKPAFLQGVFGASKNVEPALVRGVLQFILTIVVLVYFVAGLLIVWGV